MLRNFVHALWIAAFFYALGISLAVIGIDFFLETFYSKIGILFFFLLVLVEVIYNRL
ncbi:MAG: hypothetical protein NUV57_06620 [archaeon]|nr:hypothetical protein [archaeon]